MGGQVGVMGDYSNCECGFDLLVINFNGIK